MNMTDTIRQINSLRLNKVMGGNGGGQPSPTVPRIDFFYNGSTKFEASYSDPRVFPSLDAAVLYFTEKLPIAERTCGHFATWAHNSPNNWVLYVYFGPDVSDPNYSNPNYWMRFGEIKPEPYANIQEVIDGNEALKEMLVADETIIEVLDTSVI